MNTPELPKTDQTKASQATENKSEPIDLRSSEWYLNRELTWLEFNKRVLFEAEDPRTPLLERLKFIAIVSSNLDEFFMKRIGGLKQQIGAGITELSLDGRTPQQQIEECYAAVRSIEAHKFVLFNKLEAELKEHDIAIVSYKSLSQEQQLALRDHYLRDVFPLVTPQAIDPAHPFPFISNISLNLLAAVKPLDRHETILVRIKVPLSNKVPRFVQVGDAHYYVAQEDVIANNLDLLFPDTKVEFCEPFRVTRNANTEKDEENADDLLQMIESELRDRKFSPVVRLQVHSGMHMLQSGMLSAELGLSETEDVFVSDQLLAMRDLFQIVSIDLPALHDAPHHPADHPKLIGAPNIFHAIREHGTILLQHPYESFVTTVERFVREASRSPNVLAIKMTLYRTSADTKIIDYLIDAAVNGKQVAVVVELKARFDESANIRWATRMEQSGIHVTYGVVGLKTHSKVIYVVRQDYNGLRRYAHIGTGNYHAGTARMYSDLGILTCDDDLGLDLTELFNYLTTGLVSKRAYRKLLPAPEILKSSLKNKINREISKHSKQSPGLIQFKMNALEDADITEALYRASQAGVKVDLIIRDTCRLRPGIEGLSSNIRVISIVGRFLEHTRIFYFKNGGEEEYFIGSADCMKRNLESRVEVVTPIENKELQKALRDFIEVQLKDQRSAWEMHADGSYCQRTPRGDKEQLGTQEKLIQFAENRSKQASKKKTKKRNKRPH